MIGAVPTSMSATEVRQALDSGVVKAVSFAPHAHMSFGTIETGTWWTTNMNPGTVNCPSWSTPTRWTRCPMTTARR